MHFLAKEDKAGGSPVVRSNFMKETRIEYAEANLTDLLKAAAATYKASNPNEEIFHNEYFVDQAQGKVIFKFFIWKIAEPKPEQESIDRAPASESNSKSDEQGATP